MACKGSAVRSRLAPPDSQAVCLIVRKVASNEARWPIHSLRRSHSGRHRADRRFHCLVQGCRQSGGEFADTGSTGLRAPADRYCNFTTVGFTRRPVILSPSSRGLGHCPFTAATGVRLPLGTPIEKRTCNYCRSFFIHRYNDRPGRIEMTKSCLKCRYCRVKLSVWFSAAAIAISIAIMVTGVVPLSA